METFVFNKSMLLAFFSEHLRMGWLLSDLDKSGVAGYVKDMKTSVRSGGGVSMRRCRNACGRRWERQSFHLKGFVFFYLSLFAVEIHTDAKSVLLLFFRKSI